MKKAREILAMFKHHPDPTDSFVFKELGKVKDGKMAQKLLLRIDTRGYASKDFAKLEKTERFKRAVDAIGKVKPTNDLIEMLRTAAISHDRLNRLDGTIPWELYTKSFHCLAAADFEPRMCAGRNCRYVLTKELGVFFAILLRHDILSREGGIFADRLVTAIELGVPIETIKMNPQINFRVAVEVLKEFFPQCTEEWLDEWAKAFSGMYERTGAKSTASSLERPGSPS